MKTFNVKKATNDIIEYLRDWFDTNGHGCNAIIGMSGGKDSTIAAKILVEALGKERVIGVSMPDKNQGIKKAEQERFGIFCQIQCCASTAQKPG